MLKSEINIHHDLRCGTSRDMLAMIRKSGEEPIAIAYPKPLERGKLVDAEEPVPESLPDLPNIDPALFRVLDAAQLRTAQPSTHAPRIVLLHGWLHAFLQPFAGGGGAADFVFVRIEAYSLRPDRVARYEGIPDQYHWRTVRTGYSLPAPQSCQA
ncbi:hypothetical protein ACKVEX_15240 [Rhodocyclaceae bacterium SMB388]